MCNKEEYSTNAEQPKNVDHQKKSNKKTVIFCSILAMVIVAVILIFTLVCFHDWQEATCISPITCSKCGKTEGEALPHEWIDATCVAPKTCKACNLTEGHPLDEDDFLKDLAKGLEDRWILTNADEGKETLTKADWEKYFDAEYNIISKYANANFENQTMSKLAKKYVECIVQSKECLPYVGTNQWQTKYSNGVYNTRVETLYKINSITPIPVSEENKKELQNLITNGEVIDMVRDLLKTVKFEKTEESYGWKTYQAVVMNSTTIDFSHFAFEIDLIDKDGVTLTTAYSSVDNWDAGERSRFTFSTNEKFVEMEVERASWNF